MPRLDASDLTRIKRIKGADNLPNRPFATPITPGTPINNSAPTKAFVLACIDPRYIDALEEYLNATLGVNGFTYDLFILAGASLGGLNTTGSLCFYATTSWQTTLLEHIQVAILLHNVTQLLVFDHLDCGAFQLCGPPNNNNLDTQPTHIAKFNLLKTLIEGTSFVKNDGSTSGSGTSIFTAGIRGYVINDASLGRPGCFFDIQTSSYLPICQHISNASGAKVLVLGCIDPRFSSMLTSFLINYKDIQFSFDLTILAGSSLGANQSYTTFPAARSSGAPGNYPLNLIPGLGVTWGPTFFNHLSIARALHGITDVWVFDHLDCGAYKRIKFGDVNNPDLLIAPHTQELTKLMGYVNTYTSTVDYLANPETRLGFKGFVMDTNGSISKVVDNGIGTPYVGTTPFGSSRIRAPASDYTDNIAWNTGDTMTQTRNTCGVITSEVSRLCNCSYVDVDSKSGLCSSCVK
jgi:carbonic anhydrase